MSVTRGWIWQTIALLGACVVVLAGLAPVAQADLAASAGSKGAADRSERSLPDLPRGWSVSAEAGSTVLTWTSPRSIPIGSARLEILAGQDLLGYGTLSPNQQRVSVAVSPERLADQSTAWAELAVVAAGRRLDVVSSTSLQSRAVTPAVRGSLPPKGEPLAKDPGRPGPYRTVTDTYAMPGVDVAGLPAKVEVRGVVVAPRGASGPRPLVVFLHGRHSTCFKGAHRSNGDWPCPKGYQSIPSARGYLDSQRLLASQGYVTVSISANGINGQDWQLLDGGAAARSELITHHLQLWSDWSRSRSAHEAAPTAVAAAPIADVRRVLLVGHSRGGEGVNRAALDSATGPKPAWRIRGLVHIGPTAFGQNPAPGVPVVVLLPYCDGDVSDLQGQAYLDAARGYHDHAFRSAVLVVGANHNFFNAEWTPKIAKAPSWDDWGDDRDPVCGKSSPTRLSPADERSVGATYTAAAAALFLDRDTSVLPLLDGRGAQARSAKGAAVVAHALGGSRTAAVIPSQDTRIRASGGVRARDCLTAAVRARDACQHRSGWGVTPHFLPLYGLPGEPSRHGVEVSWTKAEGAARLTPKNPQDLSRRTTLELRVAVKAGAKAMRFGVRVMDARGRTAVLDTATIAGLPRSSRSFEGKTWAQSVRLSLRTPQVKSKGVDLSAITRIDVLPRSATGHLWLLDAWGWRGGLGPEPVAKLPRIDAPSITVTEGSSDQVVRVPLRVSGKAIGSERLWVEVVDPMTYEFNGGTVVDVPAGANRLYVDVPITGDTRDDYNVDYYVALKPVRGLVLGDYSGSVTVLDDDPAPTLSVEPIRELVAEGDTLEWRMSLSEPSDKGIFLELAATAPADDLPPEVSTDDLDRKWLRRHGVGPGRPRALSSTAPYLYAFIDGGQTSTTLRVPTVVDSRPEGPESVVLTLTWGDEVQLPTPAPSLVGTVSDTG